MNILKKTFDSHSVTEFLLDQKKAVINVVCVGVVPSVLGGLSASQFTHALALLGAGNGMMIGLCVLTFIILALKDWLENGGYESAITEGLELAGKAVNMYDDAKEYLSNLF